MRWRAPDTLGFALACFRRAIRANRLLARLAPRFFDSTVIERERCEQEARRRWLDQAEQAFRKVYGTAPNPRPPGPELPPLPPPRTQIAVERELATCRLWLRLGSDALQRSKLHHPHSLVNFSRLASLLKIATAFGRLSTGVHSAQPQNEPDIYTRALADLKRIYGSNAAPAPSSHDPSGPPQSKSPASDCLVQLPSENVKPNAFETAAAEFLALNAVPPLHFHKDG